MWVSSVLFMLALHTVHSQQQAVVPHGGGLQGPMPSQCCYAVGDYWPYRTCKEECAPDVCGRGWGVWESKEICCAKGVAFQEGCSERPKECWVVENFAARTCMRDDRKCLQGSGVWASKDSCCARGAAFPQGCAAVTPSQEPCWVVDTYYPARLCRQTNTLCTPGTGAATYATKEECCKPGAAFETGCSAQGPPVPCYMVDSYYPQRTCKKVDDVAVCNRGWGVFGTEEVCCAPGTAFPEGCSDVKPAAFRPSSELPTAAGAAAERRVNREGMPDGGLLNMMEKKAVAGEHDPDEGSRVAAP